MQGTTRGRLEFKHDKNSLNVKVANALGWTVVFDKYEERPQVIKEDGTKTYLPNFSSSFEELDIYVPRKLLNLTTYPIPSVTVGHEHNGAGGWRYWAQIMQSGTKLYVSEESRISLADVYCKVFIRFMKVYSEGPN